MTEYDPKADLHRCLQDPRLAAVEARRARRHLRQALRRPAAVGRIRSDVGHVRRPVRITRVRHRPVPPRLGALRRHHRRATGDAIGHVPWWPADRNEVTLHHILVRVATETARHADIVRELIDGAAGWTPANATSRPTTTPGAKPTTTA